MKLWLLTGRHGALAVGKNVEAAFEVTLIVEYCARIHYQAVSIGEPNIIPTARSRISSKGSKAMAKHTEAQSIWVKYRRISLHVAGFGYLARPCLCSYKTSSWYCRQQESPRLHHSRGLFRSSVFDLQCLFTGAQQPKQTLPRLPRTVKPVRSFARVWNSSISRMVSMSTSTATDSNSFKRHERRCSWRTAPVSSPARPVANVSRSCSSAKSE